ncbi:hypothetical protein BGZ81_006409 [Podila clonocystis]|nr:hypothetical protein BGZ82_011349 [Podila clonocystis]KAG0026399.1 hypothetical protein BGZ81_006409 [Podila clonocystis]
MSSTAQDQQLAPPSQAPQLNGLEEDDEFEEFATEDWQEADESQDTQQWDDNWDDDDVEDDFSAQLRNELQKKSA